MSAATTTKPTLTLAEFEAKAGTEIGVSRWIEVTQAMIDAFAATTHDHQFIHTNPKAAAATPFAGTIAHGFLTLSLLSTMIGDVLPSIKGRAMGVNYGFDRVRFVSPVPSGRRVRGRFQIADIKRRSPKEVQVRYAASIEIEGSERPALTADWLTLIVMA